MSDSVKGDRELLELAAKAAGYDFQLCMETGKPAIADTHGGGQFWNPLESDADALRLAVKLGMYVQVDGIAASARVWADDPEQREVYEPNGDAYAATRRCIVRAAAAIGETL